MICVSVILDRINSCIHVLILFLIDCDIQTAGRVASHLRKQGYLVATPGSKKKDFGLTGKPKFSVVKAEPAFSNMIKEYYDPLAKIAHHVCRYTLPVSY